MIGALSGKVESINAETYLIDVNGVGYELAVSAGVRELFPKTGVQAKLVVYTDVKENAILLYGFANALERQVFLLLRKVKGIGSKIALSIISSLSPEDILSSIGREDVSALRRVPGVGSKTAERLIVELREAVSEFTTQSEPRARISRLGGGGASESAANAGLSVEADVVLALERLGFAGEKAKQVVALTVERIRETGPGAADGGKQKLDSGELLRLALANI